MKKMLLKDIADSYRGWIYDIHHNYIDRDQLTLLFTGEGYNESIVRCLNTKAFVEELDNLSKKESKKEVTLKETFKIFDDLIKYLSKNGMVHENSLPGCNTIIYYGKSNEKEYWKEIARRYASDKIEDFV